MNCQDFANLISARLDGPIASDLRAALDDHLAACASCRATADAFAMQDAELRRAFAPRRDAAQRIADLVLARLQDEPVATPAPPPTPRRPPRPFPLLIATLSAAAGFALAILIFRPWTARPHAASEPPAAQPVARLALATGAVQVLPPGADDWQPLATGAPIPPLTRVRTPPDVRCEFILADGSQLRLNAGSEVKFNSNSACDLLSGQIFSVLTPGGAPFVIAAAQATITGAGAQFDLALPDRGQAVVTVVSGSTRVTRDGRDHTLSPGQRLTVTANDVRQEQIHDLMVATKWVNELLMMKGRDSAELRTRIDALFARIGHEKMATMYEAEIRALGDHCFIPLTRYVQSEASRHADQHHKRMTAARILGDVATPWCIPELIALLGDHDGEVRYYAARALQRLTQTGQGYSPDEWRRMDGARLRDAIEQWQQWWQRNRHGYPRAPLQAVAR